MIGYAHCVRHSGHTRPRIGTFSSLLQVNRPLVVELQPKWFHILDLDLYICIACLSYEQRVCPSICLSQAVIELIQMNIGSCGANYSAWRSFWLSPSTVASSVTTQSTCDSSFWVGSQKGPIELGNESQIILLPDARRKTGLFMAGHHHQILTSLGHLSLQVPLQWNAKFLTSCFVKCVFPGRSAADITQWTDWLGSSWWRWIRYCLPSKACTIWQRRLQGT